MPGPSHSRFYHPHNSGWGYIKFCYCLSSGSWLAPYGRTDRQRDRPDGLVEGINWFPLIANASKICCGYRMEKIRVFKMATRAGQKKAGRLDSDQRFQYLRSLKPPHITQPLKSAKTVGCLWRHLSLIQLGSLCVSK
jgi:hypothetical protein